MDVSQGTEFHEKSHEIQDTETFIEPDNVKRNSSCNLEGEEGILEDIILDNVFTVNEETKDSRKQSAKLNDDDKNEFISENKMEIIKKSFALFAGVDSGYISCSEVGDFTRSLGGLFRTNGGEENCTTGTLYLQGLLQPMKR